ncbi:non-specific lipid-transfer protein-like protein At5g64080 [Solanum pennellii]|uniref:Non-specific lipid-transfer protein-like protein At5g64080 n=1 Tax=Solanum pennellii TaxID=28526 RepID=A0ABM1HIL3_SOLPN|nr:non-specific lipid-transfer protein-like protein At5g64080 [Solanum pennellii]
MQILLTSSTIVSALAILLSLFLHVSSQSEDCQQVIVGLAPCLQYIQGNATTPSSGCCTQLATIVKTRPRCVCHVFSGVNVNQTLAMALPKACNVHITPSLALCQATSPAGSPLSSSTPPGERSRTSQSEDSSRGYSLKLPCYSLLFTLVIPTFSLF